MPIPAGQSSICRLNLATGQREILLQIDRGDIQSAHLTPDASQLILSLRFGSPGQPHRLYALPLPPPQQPAGKDQLRQLPRGPHHDIDPTSLPNGNRYHNFLAPLPALSLLEVRPIPGSRKLIGILRPTVARTREKGWLALLDPALNPGQPGAIRLLGIDPDRIRNFTESPTPRPATDQVLYVEHPEFRWRNPHPLSEDQILVTTDHAICLVNGSGASTTLYIETELPGELACVMPIVPAAPTDDRGAAL